MHSRDGFEVVNRILTDEVCRRAFLRRLAWTGAGVAALGALDLARIPAAFGQQARRGGTIKLGIGENIDTLDPHQTTIITAVAIHNNIYNGLLKITYDGQKVDFVPDLAHRWEIIGDRTHVFHLHEGVSFHNGEPLTAAVVKWNLERVKDVKQSPIHAWKLELLESIDTPDDHTVKLTFAKPYPFLRVALTGSTGRAGTIVSPKAVEQWGKDYGRHPVGTGPFKFVDWKEADYILLERNPNYFEPGVDGKPLPYLDKVHLKFIIEPSTLVAGIASGELDGINNVSPQFMATLRRNPNLTVHSVVGGNWNCIHFNCAREPFSDQHLRLAVAYAINREEIVKQIHFGEAIVAYGPISPPMTGFYDPEFGKRQEGQYFDMERAQAHLKQSKHAGGATVSLITPNSEYYPRQAEVLQAQLAKIGLKANIQVLDIPTFRKRWLDERDWDLVTLRWDADLDPDETLFPELHSKERWNAGRWINADFDRLVELARAEADQRQRKQYYDEAVQLIVKEAPVAVISHVNELKVFQKSVRSFQTIPANLLNMHGVWVEKA
jgi:peptide/nickel transport system substrate-binding protein